MLNWRALTWSRDLGWVALYRVGVKARCDMVCSVLPCTVLG